jgi:Pectate lyase superfamily protein
MLAALPAVLVLMGLVSIPRITATLVLTGPTYNRTATITASGSCISRGRPWDYRLCCSGSCTPGSGVSGRLPASTPQVALQCPYPNPGTFTATVVVSCWVSPESQDTEQTIVGDLTFNGYTVVDTLQEFTSAVNDDGVNGIYVKRGNYYVDAPIIINRTTPLMVYGEGYGTIFRPTVIGNEDIFRVTGCSQVRFARMGIWGTTAQQAASECDLELSQVNGSIQMRGPGDAIAENTRGSSASPYPGAVGQLGYVVDHPGARLSILGGDMTGGGSSDGTGLQYQVWVKQGWVGIWGLNVEGQPGTADFRIDSTPATGPPSYIAGVRSESGPNTSTLLEASGNARVVVMSNTGSWNMPNNPTTGLINVTGGTPTIWAIGNACAYVGLSCRSLLRGSLAGTSIVAIGNTLWMGFDPVTYPMIVGTPASAQTAHNLMTSAGYNAQLIDGTDVAGFTMPEEVAAPHALVHPKMTAQAATDFGWINIKTWGGTQAVGDGVADDTVAIQEALDSGCVTPGSMVNVYPHIFFPTGTYKVSAPLRVNVRGGPCSGKYPFNTSLQMAGDGPTASILRTTEANESLLEIGGNAYHTIADLGFDLVNATTLPTPPALPTYFGIGVDYIRGSGATQYGALLHRVDVSGGHAAVVWGHTDETNGNASENMASYSTFRDAAVAWASDSANAISNVAWDVTLKDSQYGIGNGVDFARQVSWPYTAVNAGTDTITKVAHGMLSGMGPYYLSSDGTLPGGISPSPTKHFAIRVTDDTFKLATSWQDAEAGTGIDITSQGTGTQKLRGTGSASKGQFGFHVTQDNLDNSVSPIGEGFAYLASGWKGTADRFYPGIAWSAWAPSLLVMHDSDLTVTPVPQTPGSEWAYYHRSPVGMILMDSNVMGADVKIDTFTGHRFVTFLRGAFSRYGNVQTGAPSTKSKTGF